jgi:hypothetical protein
MLRGSNGMRFEVVQQPIAQRRFNEMMQALQRGMAR